MHIMHEILESDPLYSVLLAFFQNKILTSVGPDVGRAYDYREVKSNG